MHSQFFGYRKPLELYYEDLISGNVLRPLVIQKVSKDGFQNYMKSIGKLGGQNKVPRVSDNRKIANALTPFISSLSELK